MAVFLKLVALLRSHLQPKALESNGYQHKRQRRRKAIANEVDGDDHCTCAQKDDDEHWHRNVPGVVAPWHFLFWLGGRCTVATVG